MIYLKTLPNIFRIEDKKGNLVSFKLNTAQKRLFELVQYQLKNDSKNGLRKAGQVRINIPKARQVGLSTFIKMLELSCALENMGWNTFTVAHDLDSSVKIFKKIKFAFQNLPKEVRQMLEVENDNLTSLQFTTGNKKRSSYMSTSTSGRGGTYQFLHISELGMMSLIQDKWHETFVGTKPAVENAKFVFYESTCDGGLGKYYKLTKAIENNELEFDNFFVPWFWSEDYTLQSPETDDWLKEYEYLATIYDLVQEPLNNYELSKNQLYWYYKKLKSMISEGNPTDIKSQYPFNLDEAFLTKSKNKFNLKHLQQARNRAKQPLEILKIDVGQKTIRIEVYHEIKQNANYVLAIDTSSGLGNDYTSIKVRFSDGEKIREFCKIKDKLTEDETVQVALFLANKLNQIGRCLIISEVNYGTYVTKRLRDLYSEDWIYKRFIQDPTKTYDTLIPDYGFKTTLANRDLIINEFVREFENDNIEVNSLTEFEEMEYFVWNEDKNRYEAQSGYNDDELMSDFICLQGFDYLRKYV